MLNPPDHLPRQSTSFIGRERDIADIAARLDTARLLTLVGPGGIGKTRLAIEVASDKSSTFADGTIFVPLAPITSAENIPTAIAGVFNIHLDANTDAAAQILNYLRDKILLLVLDNFEHVMDGADFIAEILQAAQDVRLLVTSREPLNLQDEWLWQVRGLPFPTDETAQATEYEAVQLFSERARRVRNDFDLQTQAPDVVQICRMVEGMPLAVELAAGWLKTLTCKQIGDEIQRNLDILKSPARDAPTRHRSIRVVFDHSWNLLTDEQRTVFPRLSVFRGGLTLEAAEKVTGATLWMLASLVDKSLLHFDDGRYSIHELLRQYGEEKLFAAGEMDKAQDAHSAYFLEFMAERLPDVKGRRQLEAINEIDADFENVRVAWLRGVDRKDVQWLDGALDTLFIHANDLRTQHVLTFSRMLSYFLDHADSDISHVRTRLWWRINARYLILTGLSSSNLMKCLEAARIENDLMEIAFCLEFLGHSLFHYEVDVTTALGCFAESIERFRALTDPYNLAHSLFNLAMIAQHHGDFAKGLKATQETLEIRQEINDKIGEAWSESRKALFTEDDSLFVQSVKTSRQIFIDMASYGGVATTDVYLGYASICRGDFDEAHSFAEESIRLAGKYNYGGGIGGSYLILAWLACMEGDYEAGKRLCQHRRVTDESNPLNEPYSLFIETMAAFGLHDYAVAQQYNNITLGEFLKQENRKQLLACISTSALLAAHDGAYKRACEILGLIFSHPKTRTGWLYKWDLITQLRANLEQQLGKAAFMAAWERGEKLDLESTVRRILAESDSTSTNIARNGMLRDPLSGRELEVLRLLERGLSNPEIADVLVITVATVRVHNRNIFDKLDVSNRTQAVVRAHELNLI